MLKKFNLTKAATFVALALFFQPLAQAETIVELPIPKLSTAEESATPRGYWIRVLKPKSGEKWTTGKTYTIKWSASHYVGNVRVYLYRNGKYYKTLGNTANDGLAAVKLGSSLLSGTAYTIAVQSHTATRCL